MNFDAARSVADTVLYEGYVLYPYRASAKKNQVRFQFGVVAPRLYAQAVGTDDDSGGTPGVSGAAEPWHTRTECLVEPGDDTDIHLLLRFLQLQARIVEQQAADGFTAVAELTASGSRLVTWDEAVEQSVELVVSLPALLAGHRSQPFSFAASEEIEVVDGGRVVRRRSPLSGRVVVTAEEIPGPYGVVRLRIDVENLSEWTADDPVGARDDALRHSLLSAHTLIGVSSGHLISMLDPPEWARPLVMSCDNRHTWPVLMGSGDVMLSAPIILYDQPEIAAESPGDLYDALEIDEILSLRTLTLTDEEKSEARATDPRSATIIDRVDAMSAEIMSRLHGALRTVQPAAGVPVLGQQEPVPGKDASVPWWDPGADSSVDPDTDSVLVGGVMLSKGSRVTLRPGRQLDDSNGARRLTDGQDLFYDGRTAIVQGVFFDVDGAEYLAVSLEDMPDVDLAHGRFLYFNPEEVEPLEPAR